MFPSPERSLTRLTAPLGAVMGALLALGLPTNPLLWDALNRNLPVQGASPTVIVAIDDVALRDYGRLSQWPTGLYARAIQTLQEAGAAAIGVDVLLGERAHDLTAGLAPGGAPLVLATSPGAPLPAPLPGPARWGVSALNISPGRVVRFAQTAYPYSGSLLPSFARELSRAAGQPAPLDTRPHLLRRPAEPPAVLPFSDVASGNVRYGALQGRVVLIGVTAAGLAPGALRDSSGEVKSGVELQAQAVGTFLRAPLRTLPPWLLVVLGALLTGGTVLLRGLWGFGLAFALLGLSAALWPLGVLLPGVTLSLAAILGTALVALERSWNLRTLEMRDPLTGFGNRLAFTRAAEHRWQHRRTRPLGLILVDLSGFRQVNAQYGRQAGDALLRHLAGELARHRRRGDMLFRWGADEFAVLLDHTTPAEVHAHAEGLQSALQGLRYRDLPVQASVGAACTGPDVDTPTALVEAASRNRYRRKYQQGQG